MKENHAERIHVDGKTVIQVILISAFTGVIIGVIDTFSCVKRFLIAQKIGKESVFARKKAERLLRDVEDHAMELIITGGIVSVTGALLQMIFPSCLLFHGYMIAGIMMLAEGIMFLYLVRTDDLMNLKQEKSV